MQNYRKVPVKRASENERLNDKKKKLLIHKKKIFFYFSERSETRNVHERWPTFGSVQNLEFC